jgi:hypothetical protein
MQQRYLKDTGRTSDAGATSGILLPTPNKWDGQRGAESKETKQARNAGGVNLLEGSKLISSVADSPANLFQWLEPDAGRVMSVGCGTSFAKLSASSGPDTCWLKTSQDCSVQRMLLDDEGDCLEEWSETWPAWGTMLNGVCYRQRPLVRRISAREYSLLPTPQHHDSRSQGMQREVKDGRIQAANGGESQSINLGTMGMMGLLPTPTKQDASNNGGPSQEQRNTPPLNSVAGGLLNPQFVEAIMGFPIGWTDLDA